MQKTILGHDDRPASSPSNNWFGLEVIAGMRVSSEAEDAPVENVLDPESETGWRAGEPGPQIIQITFSGAINIRHIQLLFRESRLARTQEFAVRYGVTGGERREIIRQQWTFSPQGSTEEVEDYRVSLKDVVILELAIIPDINNGGAHASLARLRFG